MIEEKEFGALLTISIKAITDLINAANNNKHDKNREQDYSSGESSFRNEILSDKGKINLDSQYKNYVNSLKHTGASSIPV